MKQDSEDRRLTQALRSVQRHHRRQAAIEGALWGLLLWLVFAVVLSGVCRLRPWLTRPQVWMTLSWAGGPFLLVSALGHALWPRPIRRWLLTCDARLGLAERLTTAWEIAHHHLPVTPTLATIQLEDTLQALARADARAAFQPRWPQALRWSTAALLALLALLTILPNPQERELARQAALRQAAEAQATHLETARETLAQSSTLTPEQRAAALQALEEAIRTLRDARSSPEEQQAALRQAEQRLAQLEAAARPTAEQALARAAPLNPPDIAQPLVDALRRGDLQAAQAYLQGLTDPNAPPLTTEEQQALAKTLSEMGAALVTEAPELAQAMQQAGEALQTDDPQAIHDIEQLTAKISDLAQQQQAARNLTQARAQVQRSQSTLVQTQRQAGSQASSNMQPGQSGSLSDKSGEAQNNGGGANAKGGDGSGYTTTSGHSEDSGTGAPYGDTSWERLTPQGGYLTLPREALQESGAIGPATPGSSTVSYRDIYAQYNRAAEAHLERQAYPISLREYVRDYFTSLAP